MNFNIKNENKQLDWIKKPIILAILMCVIQFFLTIMLFFVAEIPDNYLNNTIISFSTMFLSALIISILNNIKTKSIILKKELIKISLFYTIIAFILNLKSSNIGEFTSDFAEVAGFTVFAAIQFCLEFSIVYFGLWIGNRIAKNNFERGNNNDK